jgi:tripartite-type tricarboxylate transporter receptor subunit TctC
MMFATADRAARPALLIGSRPAARAAFPDRPIRVGFGFQSGGQPDQHARLR